MAPQLDDAALGVIERVKKLLALADNNSNEHEAESATAKAMELLAAYNLDMASLGGGKKDTARKDNKLKGGLYAWQRELWHAVSELNFCMYWSLKGLTRGSSYEHRILGREENVASAQVMAEYLQQTIERLARDYAAVHYPNSSIFIKPMIAFREGMGAGLSQRLRDLRKQRIEEDERKRREQEAASRHPGSAPGNALVLVDIIHNEEDLNLDHIYGLEPGTTAMRRAEREARQAAANAAVIEKLREQEAWDLAHPEEAAARKKREKEENEKRWTDYHKKEERNAKRRKGGGQQYRRATAREQRAAMPEFNDGVTKADDVGLDKQIDKSNGHRLS